MLNSQIKPSAIESIRCIGGIGTLVTSYCCYFCNCLLQKQSKGEGNTSIVCNSTQQNKHYALYQFLNDLENSPFEQGQLHVQMNSCSHSTANSSIRQQGRISNTNTAEICVADSAIGDDKLLASMTAVRIMTPIIAKIPELSSS